MKTHAKEPSVRKASVLGALILFVIASMGCSGNRPTARVASPAASNIEVHFIAAGESSSREVEVSTEQSGTLDEILVKKDQMVKKGDPMAILKDERSGDQISFLRRDLAIMRGSRDEMAMRIELRRSQMQAEAEQSAAQAQRARATYAEAVAGAPEVKIEAAQAVVDEAQAQLSQSRRERERLQKLFDEDIASQAQVERAQMEEEMALARRTRAMKELQELKIGLPGVSKARARADMIASIPDSPDTQMEISLLEKQLSIKDMEISRKEAELEIQLEREKKKTVTTPVSGQVLQIYKQVGEIVHGGLLFKIVESDEIWIEANVAEQDSSFVEKGQEVSVHFPSLEGSSNYKGRIESVGAALITPPGVAGNARFLVIRVVLDEKVPGLKPGLEADVEGGSVLAKDVLTVPMQAVVHDGAESYVMVLDGSTVRKVAVETGVSDAQKIEIKSGLKPSQEVVIDQPSRFSDGTEVDVQR